MKKLLAYAPCLLATLLPAAFIGTSLAADEVDPCCTQPMATDNLPAGGSGRQNLYRWPPATTAPISASLSVAASVEDEPPAGETVYQAKQGDTVYAVMRQTGVPVKRIISLNQLPPPYNLKAGQSLRLTGTEPATAAQPEPDQWGSHVVKPGETLYSVAHQTGIPTKEIIATNQLLSPYNLKAGQTLRLNPSAGQSGTAATTRTNAGKQEEKP